MTTSDNRLIVVRAWRDSDRLIIRLLISAGPADVPVESVFTDIESASRRLADVLGDLLDSSVTAGRPTPSEDKPQPHTKR